jgi:Kdo2-lipid IVA lauroyltransferase/acyltransferase
MAKKYGFFKKGREDRYSDNSFRRPVNFILTFFTPSLPGLSSRFMYHVVYGLLYLVSLLPLGLLYGISDVFFILIYYVIGYRKQVVMENLLIAFPEKTEKERKEIARKFYRNLTDTFIETIKLISASDKFIRKHCSLDGVSILNDLHRQGKKVQVHLGHNFNWELGNLAVPLGSPYLQLGVYMPIANKIFDRLFLKIRSRTGVQLLPANQMSRAIIPYRNTQYLLALIADQNPGNASRGYWIRFFGRPTPFQKGTERGARANNTAVIFTHLTKQKRGYYTVHFKLITVDPAALPEGELTRRYIVFLEEVIRANPEMWLWSHRRWKHEWKPEYGELL